MENSKVGVTDGEVFVGAEVMIEHKAMSRTIHRLNPKGLLLNINEEHTVLVLHRMPRNPPEIQIKDIRRNHLSKPIGHVLLPHKCDQLIIDLRSMGVEKARPRRKLMEQEQILPRSHISMVTVFQFLDHFVVLLKHFSVREGNSVHTL